MIKNISINVTYDFTVKIGMIDFKIWVHPNNASVDWGHFEASIQRFKPLMKFDRKIYRRRHSALFFLPKKVSTKISDMPVTYFNYTKTIQSLMHHDLERGGFSIAAETVLVQ